MARLRDWVLPMMLRRAGHDQQRSVAQCQRVLDARLAAAPQIEPTKACDDLLRLMAERSLAADCLLQALEQGSTSNISL